MASLNMPNNISSIEYALKSVPGHADFGVPHGDGAQNFTQMSGGVWKKFQMTNLNMPNNISSMKYALKSVPGLADVGAPHGDGDGPRTSPRCLEWSGKSFK